MGAAEWTGYSSGATTSAPSSGTTYTSYSTPLQSGASTYNYNESGTGMVDHHGNFHIPSGECDHKINEFTVLTFN